MIRATVTGTSPFAVLQVSMEQQNKCRNVQERANRGSHLLTDDVQSTMEADRGYCPMRYYKTVLTLIRQYTCMLTVFFFGAGCAHLLEVQGVHQVLLLVSIWSLRVNGGQTDCEDNMADLHQCPCVVFQLHGIALLARVTVICIALVHLELHAQGDYYELSSGPVA